MYFLTLSFYRNHLHSKRTEQMRKVLLTWLHDTRNELQQQINGFNRHFDSTVNKSNLETSQRCKSLPATSFNPFPMNSYPESVSSCPRLKVKRQSKFDAFSLETSGLVQQQNTEQDIEIVANIHHQSSEEQTTSPDRNSVTDETLQGFTYDSEYELVMSSADDRSELQTTLSLDLYNTTTYSDYPDFSISKSSKFIGQRPPSWTDHWKRRYQQSQETAKMRRLSMICDDGFKPDACSTARSDFNLKEYYQMWNSKNLVSFSFT